MSHKPQPDEQALLVRTEKGLVYLDPDNLKKITPAMIRAVQGVAMEKSVHQIAEEEGIKVNSINKRLVRVRQLLNTYTTFGAYRLLLFVRLMELQ